MDIYVARQPIFNKYEEVVAYELLYRNSTDNASTIINGDEATVDVMINSFLNIGIDQLTDGKQCFINFTENLLLRDFPTFFPSNILVVEILEDVPVTTALLEACSKLKKLGYTIALDDFLLNETNSVLLDYADIIKVDFLHSDQKNRAFLYDRIKGKPIKLLAEKVETRDEFEEAVDAGFEYFQGYFFCKPVILTGKEIPTFTLQYASLINEINKPDPDIDAITKAIEVDLSLSYKLLKLINRMSFTGRPIQSIKQAIMFLGLLELSKWISIIALKGAEIRSSEEVIKSCLIRAKMLEQVSFNAGYGRQNSEFFLLGMFSHLPTLLHRPMQEILEEVPLADEVKQALLGEENELRYLLNFVIALEKGDWKQVSVLQEELHISEFESSQLLFKAIEWADSVLSFNKMSD